MTSVLLNSLIVITLWTYGVQTLAAVQCVDLFVFESSQNEIKLPELWRRWISTDPNRKPDPIYAQNAQESLHEMFIPWLEGRNSFDFQAMIRKMHKVAALGMSGENSYGKKYKTKSIFPGKTRQEVLDAYDESQLRSLTKEERIFHKKVILTDESEFDPPLFSSQEGGFKALGKAMYKLAAAIGIKRRLPEEIEFQVKKGDRTYNIKARPKKRRGEDVYTLFWGNEIPDVVSSRSPENAFVILGNEWLVSPHRVPMPGEISSYLDRGEKTMAELRNKYFLGKLQKFGKGTKEEEVFLNLISDYYQVMINSHAFVRVNQSMLMNQINHMLYTYGYQPLYHGHIDYWAMALPHLEFRRFFIDEVREQDSGRFSLE